MEPERPMRWDSGQYERFKKERSRPFFDLLARIPDRRVRQAADLGCGTGRLTRALLERWPDAEIWGVDSSPEMLSRAGEIAGPPNLHFLLADLLEWIPPEPLDLIVSNAALQWVPDQAAALEFLAARLAPEGILAVQVPRNREEAAARILKALVSELPWRSRLPPDLRLPGVPPPSFYEEKLRALGLRAELWESTYLHRMEGPEGIVEWLKGTTLRPVLSALHGDDALAFLAALRSRIEKAYPAGPAGVIFPFRRLFFVAGRSY